MAQPSRGPAKGRQKEESSFFEDPTEGPEFGRDAKPPGLPSIQDGESHSSKHDSPEDGAVAGADSPERFALADFRHGGPLDPNLPKHILSSRLPKRRFELSSHASPEEILRNVISSSPSSFLPTMEDLQDIFANVTLLDQPTLITVARWLILYLDQSHPDISTPLVAACIKAMFDRHMLVATEPVVEAYLKSLHRTIAKGNVTAEEMGSWHLTMFQSYYAIRTDKQTNLGKAILTGQVSRLLIHLTVKLDNLPEQSFFRKPINPAILDLVLHPRLVSPGTRDLVMARAPRSSQPLSEVQKERCFASAIEQKEEGVLREFVKVMVQEVSTDDLAAERATRSSERLEREEDTLDPAETSFSVDNAESAVTTARMSWTERSDQTEGTDDPFDDLDDSLSIADERLILRAEVLLAQKSQDLEGLEVLLAKDLRPPEPGAGAGQIGSSAHRSAWLQLLHGMIASPEVTVRDILAVREMIPESAITAFTTAAMIRGLSIRGAQRKAWNVWAHHVEYAARSKRPELIDTVLLAIATHSARRIMSLPDLMALIDYWARRPRAQKRDGTEGSIKIDAYNVNAVMAKCRETRRPSVALRLWAAAESRWGVKLDSVSLSILLDTSRFFAQTPTSENRSMREEIRLFISQLSQQRLFHSVHDDVVPEDSKFAAYEADGWSKGSASVLLDPKDFKWYRENGIVEPWQIARSIFRKVVLGNWPYLRKISSPLAARQSPNEGSFLSRYFATTQPQNPMTLADKLPAKTAKYMYIIPTAHAFQAYISLLGYVGLVEQIPEVFAWMRALGRKPTWYSMCMGMAHVKEVQGEPRKTYGHGEGGARWATDEQIMREYLESWLGSGSELAMDTSGARDEGFKPVHDGRREDGTRNVVPTATDVFALRVWHMSHKVPFQARDRAI